jgi:hypothetical protein
MIPNVQANGQKCLSGKEIFGSRLRLLLTRGSN